MVNFTVKNMSAKIHKFLKSQAKKNRRSINSEILALLEERCREKERVADFLKAADDIRNSLDFTTTPEEIDRAIDEGRE